MTEYSLQQLTDELLRRREALSSLSKFRQYVAPTGHTDFANAPAQHHQLIIQQLERLERGEINKLMILAPPGSAKSTYCSVQFPVWRLARNAATKILCASNTQTLAEDFNRRRRNVVLQPPWALLAGTAPSLEREGLDHFVTNKGGGIKAAGVGSSVVGFRSELNILDDPIAKEEEALSPTALDKQWAWFNNEFRTRLVPGAPEIIVSTRWAKRDIAGRLLAEMAAGNPDEQWTVLRLPMLADRADDPLGRALGERLWPEYFTPQHVRAKQQDPYLFNTQFQQTPLDESGSWVDKDKLHYTDHPPLGDPHVVIAVDLALSVGKGDFTVFVVAQLDADRRVHILHVERMRVGPDVSVDRLFELVLHYQPMEVVLDDDNNAKVFIHLLQERVRKHAARQRPFNVHLEPMRGKDKETRATAIRAEFMRGNVRILKGPWNAALVAELLEFPSGTHDDQVDALGLIGRRLPKLGSPGRPVQPAQATALRVVPHLQSDGTTRYVLGMGLNEMFEEHERRRAAQRGRL